MVSHQRCKWCGMCLMQAALHAVLCCAVLCCAVLCCAVLCCAVLCCAVLCCAVLCCAVLCCAVHDATRMLGLLCLLPCLMWSISARHSVSIDHETVHLHLFSSPVDACTGVPHDEQSLGQIQPPVPGLIQDDSSAVASGDPASWRLVLNPRLSWD
jgi:hypothetical protein